MTRASFETITIAECDEPLVDLAKFDFVLEPSYFNQGFSTNPTMQLRSGVAEKLQTIQDGWDGQYRFKIWDGHRPRTVQNAIYQSFYDRLLIENPSWVEQEIHKATEQFVTMATIPERIPPHSTGGSVDLTLVDSSGTELNMGTVFDFFGKEAAPFYYEENDNRREVKGNRKLLREAMLNKDFTIDDDEWWHFDYGNQLWALRSSAKLAIYGEI